MRLPYTENPPKNLSEEDEQILERVKARRGEKGLIPLDLALLHAPKVADGWNSLLGAIRTRTSLPADLRELAILRPALLNRAWFEWNHHLPLLLATPSFSDPATSTAKIQVLQSISPTSQGALSDREWAVLRYADAMTGDITVPDELFAEIRRSFSEQEVVELTATVACYNMVSRFLVALDVGEQNALEPRFA